jgi:hypothetical protein
LARFARFSDSEIRLGYSESAADGLPKGIFQLDSQQSVSAKYDL